MAPWDKYGFDRKHDPFFWERTSKAIWDDGTLSFDAKIKVQEELIQEYQKEKRDHSAREASKTGPGNRDPNNPEIKKAEEYSKSIQNPNFKKHK